MAKQSSFDIASHVDLAEVKNALQQSLKEIQQRYDLKGSDSTAELDEKTSILTLTSADEFHLEAVKGIVQSKLVRRGISLKAVTYGPIEPAAKARARQTLTFQQGIPTEKAREIVKIIKQSKLKVQAAIQEDSVRVSGKDRDTLQEVIALLKGEDLDIDMQFTNYRSQ
jgi:cyclic-di-GMP-binding protein